MREFGSIRGIMKPKKKKPVPSRPIDNHYRTNVEEYELIARIAHDKGISIADYTRSRLLPTNAKEKLDALRNKQRRAGDPDEWFIPARFLNGKRP